MSGQAREEAERRADERYSESPLAPENEQRADDYADGFHHGAEWAASLNPEPSETEMEAAARVFYANQTGRDDLDTSLYRGAWIGIARAALTAARAAREAGEK